LGKRELAIERRCFITALLLLLLVRTESCSQLEDIGGGLGFAWCFLRCV